MSESNEAAIAQIIADELGFDLADITPNADLEQDLNADSLDITELVIAIEDRFDIEVLDEEVDRIRTVQDVIDLVDRKNPNV